MYYDVIGSMFGMKIVKIVCPGGFGAGVRGQSRSTAPQVVAVNVYARRSRHPPPAVSDGLSTLCLYINEQSC